jgi:cytochrome c oxidase subunit 2
VHVTVHSPERVHRFDVPALRAGTEASPGADGSLWFVARAPGELAITCGPSCGGHPEMLATVHALDDAAWSDWQDPGAHLAPAAYGKLLYEKSMCKTCHSLDGTPGTAPSFLGVFGRTETLADGSTVHVDEAYVRESILNPTAKVVKGFQPVMPPFAGQLGDKQIDALIAFLKTVKP